MSDRHHQYLFNRGHAAVKSRKNTRYCNFRPDILRNSVRTFDRQTR